MSTNTDSSTALALDGLTSEDMDDGPFLPPCDGCAEPVQPGTVLHRCSRCKCAWYHGRECQRAHYKSEHRSVCLGLVKAQAKREAHAKSAALPPDDASAAVKVEPCAICLEPISGAVALQCGHRFCHDCITEYRGVCPDARCPLCRSHMADDILASLYEDAAMASTRAHWRAAGSDEAKAESRTALRKAEAMLELDPEHRGALSLKCLLLCRLGQYEACIAQATLSAPRETMNGKVILDITPYWVNDYTTMAKCHMKLEAWDNAVAALRRAFEKVSFTSNPVWTREIFALMSVCYFEQGKFDDAIAMGMAAVSSSAACRAGPRTHFPWGCLRPHRVGCLFLRAG